MIELAPNRKRGLTLAGPLIAASGSVGFASESADLIALDRFGALVTSAVSLHRRRGSTPPRTVEVRGGLLLNRGGHNPGWRAALAQFGAAWARSQVPFIAHLVGRTSLPELARQVERARGIAALEVDLDTEESLPYLAGLRAASELPVLVRLSHARAAALAPLALEAGADALVCTAPPHGAAVVRATGQVIEGELFGPLVKPLALKALRDVLATVTAPLVACGGVHSLEDVRDFQTAGASAVMLDSLAWIDPAAANAMLVDGEW